MADENELGPAMTALTAKQRGFVMAMIEFPGISFAEAARRAGYSNVGEGAKVSGHYCAHHPGVQAAIREEAGKRLNAASLTAAGVLMQLLVDEAVEPKDRIKAAGMLLDRSGFGAAQTINVNQTTRDESGKAIMGEIMRLAEKLNVPVGRLLGAPAPAAQPAVAEVVDAEFSEVAK